MYHLENSQLRVCRRILQQPRNTEALVNTRIILLEHILSDTLELINLIVATGAEIFKIIAKPYSIDLEVFKSLTEAGFDVVNKSYKELEETPILNTIIENAIIESKKDGKKIIIIEVGGYFAKPLAKVPQEEAKYFAGVVEDTTFGHNRYLKLISKIKIPVFSVARSPLKRIEARFVGDSAVTAVDQIFREIGVSITGRNALVVGYGMIGKNIAASLRAKNLTVSIYDVDDHRNLSAFSKGYRIHKKRELLKKNDVIFSATGTSALSYNDIEECKDKAILVSAGSKDIEFDVGELRAQAMTNTVIHEHIEKFHISNGKDIYLVKEGTAVNFLIKSVPDEIIDLVFAEIMLCSILLIKKPDLNKPGQILPTPKTYLNSIAKDWLKDINR